jgi:SsrA-binding protein
MPSASDKYKQYLCGMGVSIRNKKAEFRYFLIEKFTAGMVLSGPEIKSIRAGKANIAEAYCKMVRGELYVINMNISPYANAGYIKLNERRERKLLLQQTELNKINRKLKDTGITVVPVHLFINEKGWAKLEIALAKGKNVGDKRQDAKSKDLQREQDRGLAD